VNKKKWVGILMTGSLVTGATQNYALCYDDIVDILNTEEVNKIELKNGHTIAELTRHCLRIQLDKAVADSIGPRIRAILKKHNNTEAIKELDEIEKEFSKKKGSETLKYDLIDKLLNITVRERYEYPQIPDYYSSLVEKVVKTPLKEDKELLKELITFSESEAKILIQCREYNEKMEKIENDLKTIIKQKNFNPMDIRDKVLEAMKCVKEHYSTPAGYVRYLAARGYFLDKSSFPGMSDDAYQADILPWYYISKVPSVAMNLLLDKVTELLNVPDLIMYPTKILLNPLVSAFGKKVNESLLYLLTNQDPHLSSLYKSSDLDESSLLDSFDFVEYAFNTAPDIIKKVAGIEDPPEPINTVISILSASN